MREDQGEARECNGGLWEEVAVDGNEVETKMTANSSCPHLNMVFYIHKKDVHKLLWHLYNMT